MAEDQQVEIELKAKDSASRVVRNIGKATGKLLTTVDKITKGFAGIMGRYGGIGAALSLGASVNSAKKYFDQIQRIKNVAGGTANEIASVRHAMVGAGVASADMESAYVTLAKKGGEMRANMGETNRLARRMGVDFRKGPVEALIKMSKQVKAGKIGYKELNKLGGEGMLRMRKFLNQGPQVIRQQFEAARKKMGHVNDQTMAQYSEFKKGVGKISQAWNRMVVIVGAKLLPILTKLMDGVASRIDGWAEGAAKFGDFLVKHMDAVVVAAKIFGKIMVANYLLMKLTGEGLMGNMGRLNNMARLKKGGGGGKAAAAANVASVAPMGKIGKVFKIIAKKAGFIARAFTAVFKFLPMIWKTVGILGRFTIIGLVITAVVAGVKQILKDTDGIRKRIGKLLSKIWENVKSIGETIGGIFSDDSPLGKFFSWIGSAFTGILEGVLWLVEKITAGIAIAAVMIKEGYVNTDQARNYITAREAGKRNIASQQAFAISEKLRKAYHDGVPVTQKHIDMIDKMNKLYATGGRVKGGLAGAKKYNKAFSDHFKLSETNSERPGVYQDFRGSRFDITQKFAEGFDPDRIAVAFANDLSNFGEHKVQSALLSPFTVR